MQFHRLARFLSPLARRVISMLLRYCRRSLDVHAQSSLETTVDFEMCFLQHIVRGLACLPVEADEVEAIAIHKQLCQLLTAHTQIVLGASCERLPHVLSGV